MKIPYVFKKCSKCGRWLVASTNNFYKLKSGKYGLNSQCKECYIIHYKKYYDEHKEKRKKYLEENKEKIAKQKKNYREKHKEETLEYRKKYNGENKEKIAQYSKKYYEDNKEKIANYHKKYRKENKEKIAKYRKENKEKIAKRDKKYRNSPQGQVVEFNKQSRRRQRKEQQGNGVTKEQWLDMMKFFNFKCAYSGITLNTNNRSIDHIVPIAKGGAHEVWNCVPMDRSLNSSKNDKDIEEWYPQQDFYNKDRLNKINEWRAYAYNKWGKEEKL